MKVLALKLRQLGDTVLWTSALQALVDLGAEVDLVYPRYYTALFLHDPRFRQKVGWNSNKDEQQEFSKLTKSEKYDFVLCFHASHSSLRLAKKFQTKELLCHFHDRVPKRGPSSRPIPGLGQPMKATERDLNVIRALGWSGTAPATKVFFPADGKNQDPESSQKPLVLFGISASRPAKEWPIEHFVSLAQLLSPIARIGIVYEKEEHLRGNHWKNQLASVATLIHTPSLESLMQVLSSAKLYIGSDSGVKHLAIALGLKTLTLFGPESIGEWHCGGDEQLFLQVPVSCRWNDPLPQEFSWCGFYRCPLASHACMRLISPEAVYKRVFTSLVD